MLKIPITIQEPATSVLLKTPFRAVLGDAMARGEDVKIFHGRRKTKATASALKELRKAKNVSVVETSLVGGDDLIIFVGDRHAVARVCSAEASK